MCGRETRRGSSRPASRCQFFFANFMQRWGRQARCSRLFRRPRLLPVAVSQAVRAGARREEPIHDDSSHDFDCAKYRRPLLVLLRAVRYCREESSARSAQSCLPTKAWPVLGGWATAELHSDGERFVLVKAILSSRSQPLPELHKLVDFEETTERRGPQVSGPKA